MSLAPRDGRALFRPRPQARRARDEGNARNAQARHRGAAAGGGNTNAEGVGIGGGIGSSTEGYGGHVTFYVEVPDVEAALAKAESLGGTRMMGPEKVPDVNIEIALFTDPEGHVIGLVK
jgi:predicted enzyme related to lactoylglutathione lyase